MFQDECPSETVHNEYIGLYNNNICEIHRLRIRFK